MTPIKFTVLGVPQTKGSTRAFMPKGARFPVVTSTNPHGKAWEKTVALGAIHARGAGAPVYLGAVELDLMFYLPRPQRLAKKATPPHTKRPDLDKYIRCIGDALTGICWQDDGQIVRIVAAKAYAEAGAQPRATITVRAIDFALFTHHSESREAIQ